MLLLGRMKKKQEFKAALNTVTEYMDVPSPSKHKRVVRIDDGVYMSLKAVCCRRGWTLTHGANTILRDWLIKQYEKAPPKTN
jgi:hypothetical protein